MKKLSIAALSLALITPCAYAKTDEIDSVIESLIKSSAGDRSITWSDINKPLPDLTYSFSAYNDYLVLQTNWKKAAEFPNPAKSGTFDSVVYKYSQDGVNINSTKNYIEIKADSFDKIVQHMGNFGQAIPILNRSGWRYPNIQMDHYSYSFEFDLKTFSFYAPLKFNNAVKSGEKLYSSDVNTGTVIGYRIGNGELKPVVHDSTVYDYSELKDADHFMIYAKAGKGDMKLSAAAIEVNKPQGMLKIYRTYPFPSK